MEKEEVENYITIHLLLKYTNPYLFFIVNDTYLYLPYGYRVARKFCGLNFSSSY